MQVLVREKKTEFIMDSQNRSYSETIVVYFK